VTEILQQNISFYFPALEVEPSAGKYYVRSFSFG
jgi:hypothetical protein